MLHPYHAAALRRRRSIASCLLVGIFALLAVSTWVVVRWPAAWWGMLMVVVGVAQPALALTSWMRVEVIVLVFDRPVTHHSARDRRFTMALTRGLAEVDTQLVARGLAPLGSCLELELARGVARHDPTSAHESLEVLLATPSLSLAPDIRRALEQLSASLAHAADQRARFCMTTFSGWSGLIESNLGLHYGG